MKTKSRIFVYLFAFLLIAFPAHSGNLTKADFQKLDPQLYFILSQVGIEKPATGVINSLNILNGSKNINVLIKSTLTRTELAELGVWVYSQFGGDIFTANISINQIENIITNPNISYIQKSKIVAIQNDKSMTEIKAPQARQQYNITGKGVIIGIIDTGIDWQHPDFRNPDGTTRIKALLDLSDPGDTNGDGILDGPDQYGGTFYSEQQINNALNGLGTVNETDEVGHGTHVAGSAAGNGRATSNGVPENTFVGVAPEADLIIIKGTRKHGSQNFSDVDYLNGIEFINNIASEQNKSCVINLSLGGSSGPHDGKDLSEQAIDELLSGSSAVGKAVVISAGNDGNKPIHASGTLGGAGSSVETKFDISSFTPTSSNLNDYVIFDGWYDGDNDLSVKVVTSSGRTYGPLQSGRENGYDTPDGAVYISNAKGGASNLNGDKQILIQIYDYYDSKPPKAGEWKIVISGTTGRFDLWLSGATMEASITSNLDYSTIVGTPGTAFKAITVGSYTTKKQWLDLDGNSLVNPALIIGAGSDFSSPGPTRDGRIKPEISAPGELIAASYSSDAPPTGQYSMYVSPYIQWPNAFIYKDNKHAVSQGTSFSAPHVSGAVALLLELHPNKTAQQLRQAIIASARTDSHTGAVPSDKWGYGKLDVLAAFLNVSVEKYPSNHQLITSPQLYQNYPNPFNPKTNILYSISDVKHVRLRIINQLGKTIKTLVNNVQNPGNYQIIWDGKNGQGNLVSSGLYFYRLETGKFSLTRKMVLLQ